MHLQYHQIYSQSHSLLLVSGLKNHFKKAVHKPLGNITVSPTFTVHIQCTITSLFMSRCKYNKNEEDCVEMKLNTSN